MENKDKKKVSVMQLIKSHKWYFLITFLAVLVITFSALYLLGLVPPEFQMVVGRAPDMVGTTVGSGDLPLKIEIPEVGTNAEVYDPDTTNLNVLDSYLLKGAVRYPGSGYLGVPGNLLIFGHSTSYRIVNNQAFKTFIGLKYLKPGDPIYIYSGTYVYTYSVMWVEMKEADQVVVQLDTNQSLLTLSTCNTSIGDTSARYVVQAVFVSKQPIPTSQS